jgi:hypothetical protein
MSVPNQPFIDFPFSGKYTLTVGTINGTSAQLTGTYDAESNLRTFAGTPGVPYIYSDAALDDIIVDSAGQRYRVLAYDGTSISSGTPTPAAATFTAYCENTDSTPISVNLGDGMIYRGSPYYGLSLDHVLSSGGLSEQVQQSVRSRTIMEIDNVFSRLENIYNVEHTPSANDILQYQGTNWVGIQPNALINNAYNGTTNQILIFDGSSLVPKLLTNAVSDVFNGTTNQILIYQGSNLIAQHISTAANNIDLEDLGNVTGSAVANNVLSFNGTNWIPSNVTVNTSSPITGNGTVGTPITVIDGTARSQALRYDGTDWNIKSEAFDALVGTASGSDFVTLEAAISAGSKRIAIITNTVQTSTITLTSDTYIKLFNSATLSTNNLNNSIIIGAFNLEIEGSGSLQWTPNGAPGPDYYFASTGGDLLLRGVDFIYNGTEYGKYITNRNQTLSDVVIRLADATNSGIYVSDNYNANISNLRMIGNDSYVAIKDVIEVSFLGNMNAVNLSFVDVFGFAGTTSCLKLNGRTNIRNLDFLNTTRHDILIQSDKIYTNEPIGPTNISGFGSRNGTINFDVSNNMPIILSHGSDVGYVNINTQNSRLSNISYIGGIVTINNSNISIDNCTCSNNVFVPTSISNLFITNSYLGSFTGTHLDSSLISGCNVGGISITSTIGNISVKNRIIGNECSNISVTGDNNIIANNYIVNNLTVGSGSNSTILNCNIVGGSIITTGSLGTIQLGNL